MQFRHSDAIWQAFPELRAGALHVDAIHADADVETAIARFRAIAEARLAAAQEGNFLKSRRGGAAFPAWG